MKRLDYRALAAGVALGGAAMLLMGQTATERPTPFQNQSVDEILFPRRQEGIVVLGDGTALAPAKTDVEELMALVNKNDTEVGRYQAVALGAGNNFVVIDTQNGLTRAYLDETRMLLYNVRVPNHVIETRVRKHTGLVD